MTQSLEEAMEKYPDTYAVLVRRHGVYVFSIILRHSTENLLDMYGEMMYRKPRHKQKGDPYF